MEQRTEIAQFGEFGLITHLTRNIDIQNASTILGVGDDAAVIDHFGKQTVITTDLLIEGVHFDLTYTPLKHLGYKSVVVNLSDIYAMNATPTQITMSIGLSNRFSVEAIEEFYEGVYAACEKYGVDLVGGDTASSQKGFIVSVTALGEIEPNKLVKRDGAKPGDLLCCSGDLGAAYIGLLFLEREKKIFIESPQIQPDLEGEDFVIRRLLKPETRKIWPGGDVRVLRLVASAVEPDYDAHAREDIAFLTFDSDQVLNRCGAGAEGGRKVAPSAAAAQRMKRKICRRTGNMRGPPVLCTNTAPAQRTARRSETLEAWRPENGLAGNSRYCSHRAVQRRPIAFRV